MSSVPSGPSVEDERREARWQLFAAISEAVEARSFPEDEGDHPVRQALNRYVELLASRAPAGEPTSEEQLKVVMHEALDTFGTWTPKQRHERAGYDGYYNRPPDWLIRFLAGSVAKSLAAGAAPDGRASDELVEAAREARATWIAAPMTNAMFAPMKRLGDALSALAEDRRTP